MQHLLSDETATKQFAKQLAECVQAPLVIYLQGELGAGKTTLVRALLHTLGVQDTIKSPTFSIIETYNTERYNIIHVDLYRLATAEELEYIGLRDYLEQDVICCVEWPERASAILPKADIVCYLSFEKQGRLLQLTASTEKGQELVKALVLKLEREY